MDMCFLIAVSITDLCIDKTLTSIKLALMIQ
jgi:hypothetical protein